MNQNNKYTIELAEEQYKALALGESIIITLPNKEKWEPKGGDWIISAGGGVLPYGSCITPKATEFGHVYGTEEQAKQARDLMRSFNRQLKWLAENDDGWRADWSDFDQKKWYVTYIHNIRRYGVSYNGAYQMVGVVYMSEDNAKKLCNLLNKGIVEL